MTAGLRVVRPGMLSTVQDAGRWGYQHLGVPVAGPMDWYSHALANRMAGNAADAAALEITLIGPDLEATGGDVTCAVAGAAFDVALAGRRIDTRAPFVIRDGQRIRFGARSAGTRAAVAIAGGLAVAPTLGSRATSLTSRMGPFDGRPLRAGDLLPIGPTARLEVRVGEPLPLPQGGASVRVMPGPHDEHFTRRGLETLATSRFAITPESNRMGYRLSGPPIERASDAEILSDATPVGSIQIPPSGQPILLMADRQTTGGYPKIATVITADLPIVGQLAPGDWIAFELCTRAEAAQALRERMAALEGAGK